MKYKDYYAALDIPRDADLDQIKKAYRKLARQYHPDVSKAADAEARFKDAAEAYATLKNPEKRAAYDALGQPRPGEEFSPPPQWSHAHGQDATGFGEMDLEDLLAAMGQGRGTRPQGRRPAPGRDYEDTVHISLRDAQHGTELHLSLGDTDGERNLTVTIPVGVIAGQKLRLRGKGGPGRHGGENGDIYLHIVFKPDPIFRADRHDLYFDLALAPWEAALGAELEVPTLDGKVVLTVPAGTRAGRKLRLRGRGLANPRGTAGDLYATVRIDIAPTLSEQERVLYQGLAILSSFDLRSHLNQETPNEPTRP